MGRWWFETGLVEEVVDVLACSYLERAHRRPSAPVRFLDRGVPMLEASVAATVAFREQLAPQAAADRARALLAPYVRDLQAAEAAEHAVVLVHCTDPAEGTRRSLSHEARVTNAYAAYQRHLHDQVNRLVASGRFAYVITVGDRPTIAVQDELRQRVHALHLAIPTRALAGVRVVALGGLSESGKSTAGEYLRTRHGHARLKIGHLLADTADRCQITDPYALGDATQAELIVDALDRYCAAHHFLDQVSIESLHSLGSTAELTRMLGPQLTITYLQTPFAVRAARSPLGARDVTERDRTKISRGAEKIAGIAHEVIDNSGSRLQLERRLDRLALGIRWPSHRPSTVPVNTLGLPVHLEAYLSAVLEQMTGAQPLIDLLAVTGSGAQGKYQHCWSDLDVFVVAASDALPGMREILAGLEGELGGVKLGLTVLTREECATGVVSSRLLHVLALLGTGALTALWCAPGLTLPTPAAADDVEASVRDGIQAAIEIRRQLLRPTFDLRTLYKVTALLAKIQLRFAGTECPADDDALTTLLTGIHPEINGLLSAARTDHDQAEALARLVLELWLSTVREGTP
ncbi:nucleotidyltransferase domain-containing protein [Actinomadura craniellae]|uniref:Nucleotidyltransferase domain-containing protein n=2 Tax=Actinomadura craniellae TaxID=2231787 RepID=A0A365HDR0_9ACTN|nr:nucleotidyltransferase domain-containing protein [Actinomadura craniellae]